MKRLLAAVRFLTILPVPGGWGTAEEDLSGSVAFFPVAGLFLGAAAGTMAWALGAVDAPMLAGAVLVVAMIAFSGGLHMDGLADTADGFLSSRTRDRVLEIMKDSRTGAMGVMAIAAVLLIKFAAVASLGEARLWRAAFLMPLAGRAAIVVNMALLPYARPGGIATVFYVRPPRMAALWAAAVLGAAGWAVAGWSGLAAAGACVGAALAFAVYSRRRIGGATGDTFGAVCEIVEVVPALVIAAWPVGGAG